MEIPEMRQTVNTSALDLQALDDAWAAVAALSSGDETRGERCALDTVCRVIEGLGGRNPRDVTRRPYPKITDYRRFWGAKLRTEMFGQEVEGEQTFSLSGADDELQMIVWAKGL